MSREAVILERTVAEALRRAKLLFAPRRGNQSSTGNASSTQAGLVPPVPADATKFLNGAAPPAYAHVKDSDLALSDITTNDVSITEHGFAPKAPNDATKYLDGTGTYSVPAVSGGTPPAFPTITNLELRFSAKYSTVTRATDGRVTNITDLSGNGRNSNTLAGTDRPLYFRDAFNGHPCFGFDGAGSPMHITVALGTTFAAPFTVVLVLMNYNGGSPSQHLYRDNAAGAIGFNNGGSSWSMFNGTTVSSAALFTQNVANPLPNGRTAHAAVRIDQFDGANSICANNNVEVSIGNPGTAAGGIHSTFLIGSGFDTGAADQGARMLLYEFLIFSRALTLTERNALRTYYSDPLIADIDLI